MRWMLPFPKHSKVILFYPCSIGDQRSPSLRGEATRRVGWKIIKDEIVVWVLGGSSRLLSFRKENKTIEKHLRVVFAFSRKFMFNQCSIKHHKNPTLSSLSSWCLIFGRVRYIRFARCCERCQSLSSWSKEATPCPRCKWFCHFPVELGCDNAADRPKQLTSAAIRSMCLSQIYFNTKRPTGWFYYSLPVLFAHIISYIIICIHIIYI